MCCPCQYHHFRPRMRLVIESTSPVQTTSTPPGLSSCVMEDISDRGAEKCSITPSMVTTSYEPAARVASDDKYSWYTVNPRLRAILQDQSDSSRPSASKPRRRAAKRRSPVAQPTSSNRP